MGKTNWSLDDLIDRKCLEFETTISKNEDDLSTWLDYYGYKNSLPEVTFKEKVFILERAVRELPGSYELWEVYIDECAGKIKNADYIKHKKKFKVVNRLFERSLVLLSTSSSLWTKYLRFILDTQSSEVTLIRKVFNRSLLALPVSQHHFIWPLYIEFADMVGGPTGCLIYKKYMLYATPESLQGISPDIDTGLDITISDIISKIADFGCIEYALTLIQELLVNPERYAMLPSSLLDLWLQFIDFFILASKEKEKSLNLRDLDFEFEQKVSFALKIFPDQISKLYLKLVEYFTLKDNHSKVRYYFEKGLRDSLTVSDFTTLFESYLEFEENVLLNLSNKLESGQYNKDLVLELDLRMYEFENLVASRKILLNDMMIRQNPNNLDEWFKRIEYYEKDNKLTEMLTTYANALGTVNPLKAHSISSSKKHTLPKLWINYALFYGSKGDISTANLIFSKSVQSEFKSPDDLVELYITWSNMHLDRGNIDAAIDVLEQVCTGEENPYAYNDTSVKIRHRVGKSTELWSHYIDVLEASVTDTDDKSSIERVCEAYDKAIDLKVASVLTLMNYANFLEEMKLVERSFTVYELGIQFFSDPKLRYQIWNVYLSKAMSFIQNLERIRDLFEQCIFGMGSGAEKSGCPGRLCKPLFLLYVKFEEQNGSYLSALRLLELCVQKMGEDLRSRSISKKEIEALRNDKYEIYNLMVSKAKKLGDNDEVRRLYEQVINDHDLPLPKTIEFGFHFIDLETLLKQFNRARSIFKFICRSDHPDAAIMKNPWSKWKDFEINYGSEASFKDMLRFKRNVEVEFKNQGIILDNSKNIGFVKSTSTTKAEENINPEALDIDLDI